MNESPDKCAPTCTDTSVNPPPRISLGKLRVGEAEPPVTEALLHPALIVRAQVEHQDAAIKVVTERLLAAPPHPFANRLGKLPFPRGSTMVTPGPGC